MHLPLPCSNKSFVHAQVISFTYFKECSDHESLMRKQACRKSILLRLRKHFFLFLNNLIACQDVQIESISIPQLYYNEWKRKTAFLAQQSLNNWSSEWRLTGDASLALIWNECDRLFIKDLSLFTTEGSFALTLSAVRDRVQSRFRQQPCSFPHVYHLNPLAKSFL